MNTRKREKREMNLYCLIYFLHKFYLILKKFKIITLHFIISYLNYLNFAFYYMVNSTICFGQFLCQNGRFETLNIRYLLKI